MIAWINIEGEGWRRKRLLSREWEGTEGEENRCTEVDLAKGSQCQAHPITREGRGFP
jgi:hypothetical protein